MKTWQDHRAFYLMYFCGVFFFFQVIRGTNGLCLSQLGDAFIFQPRQDPLVWLYIASGFPSFILDKFWLSFAFDVLIYTLPVLLYYTQDKRLYKFAFVFFLIYSLYLFTAFVYPTLSIRKYLGLALISLLFASKDVGFYKRGLKYFRYYVCFIFVSAALWKMTRGTLFSSEQFTTILTTQHFDHALFFPDHVTSHLNAFLLSYPAIAFVFYLLVGLFQLAFIIGFFTRKFDKYLALALILFVIGDYLVMRIEYWEFAVFLPLFFMPMASCQSKH